MDEGSFWEMGKAAGVATMTMRGISSSSCRRTLCLALRILTAGRQWWWGDDFSSSWRLERCINFGEAGIRDDCGRNATPHVRLLDGMSGGGSVKTIEQAGRTYIPLLPGWHTVCDHLNIAPSVSLVLGSVAGFEPLVQLRRIIRSWFGIPRR